MYGKKVMGTIRSSFLIDERGKIMQAWYKIKPDETAPKAPTMELRTLLQRLKILIPNRPKIIENVVEKMA